MSDLIFGIILGLISSALFAFQNVLIRSQSEGVGALVSNSIKMWVSVPLMLVLVIVPWRVHEFLLPGSVLLPLAISVLLGGAFGDAVYLSSQERIGVSKAFPISNTYPIITYLLALVLLNEILQFTTITGISLAVIGVILVSKELSNEKKDEEKKTHDWKGLALAIASSIMFAFATIYMEIGVKDIDPIDANLFRLSIGSLAMIPIFSLSVKSRIQPLSKRAMKVVAIAGFFGMGLASLLYVASIKLVGATIGAVIGSTAPLFALPVSVFYLKERITWRGIIGTIATIVGIWLVVVGT
ncbi:DMT family transporter [Candidatus Thorarchaeota archaeon]|nr:MAG: DMT family transporter [Candidatus Thorarchaeota archaeon]